VSVGRFALSLIAARLAAVFAHLALRGQPTEYQWRDEGYSSRGSG
jgi:hypothetical protein